MYTHRGRVQLGGGGGGEGSSAQSWEPRDPPSIFARSPTLHPPRGGQPLGPRGVSHPGLQARARQWRPTGRPSVAWGPRPTPRRVPGISRPPARAPGRREEGVGGGGIFGPMDLPARSRALPLDPLSPPFLVLSQANSNLFLLDLIPLSYFVAVPYPRPAACPGREGRVEGAALETWAGSCPRVRSPDPKEGVDQQRSPRPSFPGSTNWNLAEVEKRCKGGGGCSVLGSDAGSVSLS